MLDVLTTTPDDYVQDPGAAPTVHLQCPSDVELARDVQRALRALAQHRPRYARVLAGRPGVRLAGHVASGEVALVTATGLEALCAARSLLLRASAIEPDLDTNTFMDRLLMRTNPHAGSP